MKKLTALFMGCIMIAGAFASCGKDDSGSSKKESDPLTGKWNMEDTEDGFDMYMNFNDGTLGLDMDFSSVLYFSGKDAVVEGDNYGPDGTVFEDNKLTLTLQGTEIISMTRIEGEGDSLDGTYNELGGVFLEGIVEGSDVETTAKIDGEKFFISYNNFCDYSIDGDEITLKNPPAMILSDSEEDETVMTFKISGDTLTLTDKNDTTQTLTRVK